MNYNNNSGKYIFFGVMVFFGIFFIFPFIFMAFDATRQMMFFFPLLIFFMMIGMVVFMMYHITRSNRNTQVEDEYSLDQRQCIHCNESIGTNLKYCPHCGNEQTKYIVCEYCGHHNNLDNLQCEKCNALIK